MKSNVTLVASLFVLLGASGQALAQDVAAGERSFLKCKACHQLGPDAKNAVGPILNGIIGRKSGQIEGYNYSDANKGSGITWDEATFKIPGTKMAFAGINNETEINNLFAYLVQFDAKGGKK